MAPDGGTEDATSETQGGRDGGGVEDVTVGVDAQADPDASADAGGDSVADADANATPPDAPPPCATGSNVLVLPFSSHPELAMAGGSVLVDMTPYMDPVCGAPGEIIVVSPSQGSYVALSGACTNECCFLKYEVDAGDAGVLQCVCHYGTFDLNGNPLGSSLPPLQKFAVCATSYGVYVTY
ncbi:MAG TPA: Rieske 2Fe-2S domain-containing protein [Polyangiaceae bacterium]